MKEKKLTKLSLKEEVVLKIKDLESKIEFYIKADNDFNFKPIPRLKRHIELLEYGLDVKEVQHGFLVNDKFIIAAIKNKWRIDGRWIWYSFRNISDFVNKYVKTNK